MSENIVKFGGDTTVRELWEGGPTGSTGVSRILNPGNSSFSMVAFQQAKPLLDSEMNLTQQIQNKVRADMLRTLLSSGIIDMNIQTNVTDKLNTIRISGAKAHVNGWLIDMCGQNRSDSASDIVFPAAPYTGSREDFAFIEAWFEEVAPTGSPEDDDENVYKWGGINSGTTANNILDSTAEDETTRRIQLRWNIRTVPDVNFTAYPEGVNNTDRVKARGGADGDTNYGFALVSDGLYRAGDGGSGSATALSCVDGYVYALPIARVHRRNQTAYNADDNISGAGIYPAASGRPDGLYSNIIAPCDVTPLFREATVYDGGNTPTYTAMIKQAGIDIRLVQTELDKWRTNRLQQGTAQVYNKFVVSGCVINAISGTRNIKVSRTGTYSAANYSLAYIDGKMIGINDTETSVAAVPTNSGTSAAVYYAYIDGSGSDYAVRVAAAVPAGKLGLYRITVPAADTAANLNAVSFTDIRRVESSTNFYAAAPTVAVPLKGIIAGAPNYDVRLTVESATDMNRAQLRVTDKSTDQFTVTLFGEADNIIFRWTASSPAE